MLLVSLAVPLIILLAGVSYVLYQLAKQQGRLLLRLDDLEGRLVAAEALPHTGHLDRRLPHERSLSESRIERRGLKPGARAPNFTLPDVRGGEVSLEQYRGWPVLLVFTDPHCGPCDELAPMLARLHRQHSQKKVALVVVGRGDPTENRRKAEEHGLDCPVVLQRSWELSKQYGLFAVPAAFLISTDQLIVRSAATGVDEILAMTNEALASAEEANDEQAVR